VNECKTGAIDWCSFDFYETTLSVESQQRWVQRQNNPEDDSFRNGLRISRWPTFNLFVPQPPQRGPRPVPEPMSDGEGLPPGIFANF